MLHIRYNPNFIGYGTFFLRFFFNNVKSVMVGKTRLFAQPYKRVVDVRSTPINVPISDYVLATIDTATENSRIIQVPLIAPFLEQTD